MPKGGNSRNFSGCEVPSGMPTGEVGRDEVEESELDARLEVGRELRLKLCRKLLDRDRTKSPKSNMIELPVDISHNTVFFFIKKQEFHFVKLRAFFEVTLHGQNSELYNLKTLF